MMKSYWHWLAVICLTLVTGCGMEGPAPSGRKNDEAVANKTPQPAAPTAPAGDRKSRDKTAGGKADAKELAAGQMPGTVREKAAVGMGEKGRGYGGDMITIPFKTYWVGKELITLAQIKHDLDLYKAGEGNGKGPKTHEEFMEKIIKPANIRLPPLPAGQRYVYDPDTEELLVERPGLE